MQLGKTIHELKVGDKDSFTKTIAESDVYLFAGITGDFNPVHVNEEFAKKGLFGTRVAHGTLTLSLIAPVLGMKLPGLGTVLTDIKMKFLAPARIGDTITATAEVINIDIPKSRVAMRLTYTNQHGKLISAGEAVVLPPPAHRNT
ncbi:MAG: MaoC family dehydratase [Syntrophothermus sp.]